MPSRYSFALALALAAPSGAALADAVPSGTDAARMLTAAPRHAGLLERRTDRASTGTDEARGIGREPGDAAPPSRRPATPGGTDDARGIGAGFAAMAARMIR
jgi:hypothetical protein